MRISNIAMCPGVRKHWYIYIATYDPILKLVFRRIKMQIASVFVLLIACVAAQRSAVDLTIKEGATGSDIVLATVAKIESSGIFPSDKRLLRRIAYVETEDGENPPAKDGGIWNVPMEEFLKTQSEPYLAVFLLKINTSFEKELTQSNVDSWQALEWKDLSRPLWSGLAARLRITLLRISERLPTSSDAIGQAVFWKKLYNADGNLDKFIAATEKLDMEEGCEVKSDVIFVLDSSGSIGITNFLDVISFVREFVNQLEIGPTENQVGVILYHTYGITVFDLNTYSDKEELLSAIGNIIYTGGGTNTAEGLCLMLQGFTKPKGARLLEGNVIKLGVVMTDGYSGGVSSIFCDYSTSIEVAGMIHNYSQPIIMFSIGVTTSVNEAELEAIASGKEYVTFIDRFDNDLFVETGDEQTYQLCVKTTIPIHPGIKYKGSLGKGEKVRYVVEVPQEGTTVKLCVSKGAVTLYGSHKVPNPNEALYDYKKTVKKLAKNNCDDFYIPSKPEESGDDNNDGVSSNNSTFTLYTLLEGLEEENVYVLELTEGDSSTEGESNGDEKWPAVVISTLIIVGLVCLIAFLTVVFFLWRREVKGQYCGTGK